MTKQPSLRDIAKQADVALSTVSQVLNNKPGVSPETRQHVLKVASELGYRYKVSVNAPVSPQLSTIGLVTKRFNGDPMNINPFYSYVLAGAERECQRHNISLMYANIEVDEDNHALSWPSMLLDQRVDGVIVVGAFLEETISHISRSAGQNIVLVDAYTANTATFDSVLIDNYNGAISAVNFLIENGHRHIGLIGSHLHSYPSILERRRGYEAALHQHGIEDIYIEDCALDRPYAFQATLRLLKRAPHITAIFACNDNVAVGVMNAAQNLGYKVPEDLSVIGFDDIDLAQEVTPPLTTMHVDKVLMGALALRHLRDRAETPDRTPIKTMISTQVIVRESVRDINE
jgi:LacI family transcriptional regulator